MTPKEKAVELCDKFLRTYKVSLFPPFNKASDEAKQCALIAVDEILSLMIKFHNRHIEDNSNEIIFWELVKEEINEL
jgi:hypothetical protein